MDPIRDLIARVTHIRRQLEGEISQIERECDDLRDIITPSILIKPREPEKEPSPPPEKENSENEEEKQMEIIENAVQKAQCLLQSMKIKRASNGCSQSDEANSGYSKVAEEEPSPILRAASAIDRNKSAKSGQSFSIASKTNKPSLSSSSSSSRLKPRADGRPSSQLADGSERTSSSSSSSKIAPPIFVKCSSSSSSLNPSRKPAGSSATVGRGVSGRKPSSSSSTGLPSRRSATAPILAKTTPYLANEPRTRGRPASRVGEKNPSISSIRSRGRISSSSALPATAAAPVAALKKGANAVGSGSHSLSPIMAAAAGIKRSTAEKSVSESAGKTQRASRPPSSSSSTTASATTISAGSASAVTNAIVETNTASASSAARKNLSLPPPIDAVDALKDVFRPYRVSPLRKFAIDSQFSTENDDKAEMAALLRKKLRLRRKYFHQLRKKSVGTDGTADAASTDADAESFAKKLSLCFLGNDEDGTDDDGLRLVRDSSKIIGEISRLRSTLELVVVDDDDDERSIRVGGESSSTSTVGVDDDKNGNFASLPSSTHRRITMTERRRAIESALRNYDPLPDKVVELIYDWNRVERPEAAAKPSRITPSETSRPSSTSTNLVGIDRDDANFVAGRSFFSSCRDLHEHNLARFDENDLKRSSVLKTENAMSKTQIDLVSSMEKVLGVFFTRHVVDNEGENSITWTANVGKIISSILNYNGLKEPIILDG